MTSSHSFEFFFSLVKINLHSYKCFFLLCWIDPLPPDQCTLETDVNPPLGRCMGYPAFLLSCPFPMDWVTCLMDLIQWSTFPAAWIATVMGPTPRGRNAFAVSSSPLPPQSFPLAWVVLPVVDQPVWSVPPEGRNTVAVGSHLGASSSCFEWT